LRVFSLLFPEKSRRRRDDSGAHARDGERLVGAGRQRVAELLVGEDTARLVVFHQIDHDL
jgi:hypothetical protein